MGYDMCTVHALTADDEESGDTYLHRTLWGMCALREALIVTGAGFDPAVYGFTVPNAWLGVQGEGVFTFPDADQYGLTSDDEGLVGDRLDEYTAACEAVLAQHGPRDVPGIPVFPKLGDNSGWWVTKIECQAAVAIIDRWLQAHGSSTEQAIEAVQRRCARGQSRRLPQANDQAPMSDEQIILELGDALPFLRNAAAHDGFRVY